MAGRARWIGKLRQRAHHSMFARRVTLPVSRLIRVDEMAGEPLVVSAILALVVGKPLGFIGMAWLATALGFARRPDQVLWRHIVGAGLPGGMGFTISLFIAELAFSSGEDLGEAKIGVLIASAVAGLAGYLLLLLTTARRHSAES